MAKQTQGTFEVPGGFRIQNPFPPDDRMTVELFADLTNSSGDLKTQNLYEGMIVYVSETGVKKHFKWNGQDRTQASNWKEITIGSNVIQESTIFVIYSSSNLQSDIASEFNSSSAKTINDVSSVFFRVILTSTNTTKLYRLISSPDNVSSKVEAGQLDKN